jgi:hypothetical protein
MSSNNNKESTITPTQPTPEVNSTTRPNEMFPVNLDNRSNVIPRVTQEASFGDVSFDVVVPLKVREHTIQSDTAVNNNNYVLVHHEQNSHYILSEYCIPVSNKSNVQAATPCKFPTRGCVIKRSKCLQTGTNLNDLSASVYKPNPSDNLKMSFTVLDTQVIKCFVPKCNSTNGGSPKTFHYSCYVNSIENNREHDMHFIEYMGIDDKLLEMFPDTNKNLKKIIKDFRCNTSKLFFPVCGKKCYNKVVAIRNKVVTTLPRSVLANWDKDGINGNKSSISILIDWMTTEGNMAKYFGGLNKSGKTNGDRKEVYHNQLRDMISNENGELEFQHTFIIIIIYVVLISTDTNCFYLINGVTGMYRSPESIRTKIVRIMKMYKKAQDRFNTSGNGLEGIEYSDFHTRVLNETCRFYDDLHPILGDRPNVTPWITNEDPDFDKVDDNSCSNESEDSDSSDVDECLNTSNQNQVSIDMDVVTNTSTSSICNSMVHEVIDLSSSDDRKKKSKVSELSDSSDDNVVATKKKNNNRTSSRSTSGDSGKTKSKGASKKKQKLSPIDAKSKQKSLLRQNKKQINKKTNDSKLTDLLEAEQVERDYMMDSRKQKMTFEKERHSDMKIIESQKLRLDEKRLELEMTSFQLKQEQMKLQTDYEKNKVTLQRIELFKRREELKKQHNVSDEVCDLHFPM